MRLIVGRSGVFDRNSGVVGTELWYGPGGADHFQNVACLLAGTLQSHGCHRRGCSTSILFQHAKRLIVGRFGLEASRCETLRRSCAPQWDVSALTRRTVGGSSVHASHCRRLRRSSVAPLETPAFTLRTVGGSSVHAPQCRKLRRFMRRTTVCLGVFGPNFGVIWLEPCCAPGGAAHFQNVAARLAEGLHFLDDTHEARRPPSCSSTPSRLLSARLGLEAPLRGAPRRSRRVPERRRRRASPPFGTGTLQVSLGIPEKQ